MLRKTTQGARYFVPPSGGEKITVNIVHSDHDMRDTVVRVTGPWAAESENDRGIIPIVWNLGSAPHGWALPTTDIEAKLQKLTSIDYDHHN